MQVTLKVCDACYPTQTALDAALAEGIVVQQARVYEIKSEDGRKAKPALCEAHSQTVEAFLHPAPPRPAGGDSGPRRPRKRVTTLDEIEKLKK